LLANGLPLKAGDEVLLTRGDFPSVIYPWLGLQDAGVKVRFVDPESDVLTADELAEACSSATRVFCATWVHSFSGRTIDLEALGTACRQRGVTFVVNTTQAVGARAIDVSSAPIDALVNVGFKWLCGPYGTGFCWIRQELLQTLRINQTYWLSLQTADDLGNPNAELVRPTGPLTGRRYDIFGTANFFNYAPWTASLDFLQSIGIEAIARHDQALVDRFIDGLDADLYRVTSPLQGPSRSTLVLLTHRDSARNASLYKDLKSRRIHLAFRRGRLRLAPHLYNTANDIDRALEALHQLADA
jgi:selenocysteine lyase/cysteine desulfurase